MKLQFLKEIPLETLRKNIEHNFSNYSSPTNEWIYTFFENEGSPFLDFKKEVPDFELAAQIRDMMLKVKALD